MDSPDDDPLSHGASDETLASQHPPTGRHDSTVALGQLIDRYVILQELGRGGMGVVYAAYDPQLDRKVAIKLLHPGRDSDDARQRLLREAQAMARVSHPNVMPIYDVGTTSDSVFMAMEFVEGENLADHLRRLSPAWPEVVRLFLLAGRGLAAAHQAGLVHRDFKPANVLVGRDGAVRVIDFGLAREDRPKPDPEVPDPLREESGPRALQLALTQAGVVMGTPLYMAPEQMRGQAADARADQFAFSVALWEALFGELPFKADSLSALHEEILRKRLRAPPKRSSVPQWVRRVLERGLSPDAQDRWPSVDALLEALQSDPRVRARRRALVAVTAVLVVGSFATWQVLEARARVACETEAGELTWSSDAQRVHEAFTRSGAPFAEDAWKTVSQRLESLSARWLALKDELCRTPRESMRKATCLRERAQEVSSLVSVLADADLKVVEGSVTAVHALAPISECAGDMPRAVPLEPRLAAKATQVNGHLQLARTLGTSGRLPAGLGHAVEAEAISRDAGIASLLSESLLQKAELETTLGHRKEAETALDEAIWTAQLAHSDSLTVRGWNQLAMLLGVDDNRPLEGLHFTRFAEALIARDGPNPELEADTLRARAAMLEQQGKFDEALPLYREVLARREALYGSLHPAVARALSWVGNVLIRSSQFAEALPIHERALKIRTQLLGPMHPETAVSDHNVAICLSHLGQNERAIGFLEQALAVDTALYGPHAQSAALTRQRLAKAWLEAGRLDKAHEAIATALDDLIAATADDSPVIAPALLVAGRVRLSEGKGAEAKELLSRGLAIRERQMGPKNNVLGEYLRGLGDCAMGEGHPLRALELYERVLQLDGTEKTPAEERALVEWSLAQALWDARPAERALALQHAYRAQKLFSESIAESQGDAVGLWIDAHRLP